MWQPMVGFTEVLKGSKEAVTAGALGTLALTKEVLQSGSAIHDLQPPCWYRCCCFFCRCVFWGAMIGTLAAWWNILRRRNI